MHSDALFFGFLDFFDHRDTVEAGLAELAS